MACQRKAARDAWAAPCAWRTGQETPCGGAVRRMRSCGAWREGALAEAFVGKTSDLNTKLNAACDCLNHGGGIHDHAKARELVNLLRNLRFPERKTEAEHQAELNAIEQEVWGRAVSIVQDEETLIAEISAKLTSMVKLTATEYTLEAEGIAAMPCVAERFGAGCP